jgi:hypothetical protein
MSYRSLALSVAALSSLCVSSADAQSVYVAPGGVYIGGGPVYVTPAPNNGPGPYLAPSYGYGYGPPAVVAPPVVAPTAGYGPDAGYGYYGAPVADYAAELPPRPVVPVPYGGGRCVARYGYGRSCY